MWWTCDDFADIITRDGVRRSTGGVLALSEPDFGALLEHIMSFSTVSVDYYYTENIYCNSTLLFTLNF